MRVRKPTSKRTTTRMREGIKKKSLAHQRKQRKQSKKDVTWKSRKPRDPGIPASFPYKDRIVQQIEDSRRLELEEKLRKRLEKRQLALEAGEEVMEDSDIEEEAPEGGRLLALLESAQAAATGYEEEASDDDEMDEDAEVVEYDLSDSDDDEEGAKDKSRKAFDKIFKTVVDSSDVILYVLDARDPEGTRSRKVEEAVLQSQSQGKRLIFILNKVDLIPDLVLKQWVEFLKNSFPVIPLKAASGTSNATSFNKTLTQQATSKQLLNALKSYANKSNLKRSIIVGVIGYPNVGKSSIINSLLSRHGGNKVACPVGNQAGVTTSLREVKVDNKLKILDSPGIVFPASSKKSKKQQEAELALLNALPPKDIQDPVFAITLLVKKLAKDPQMSEGFKKLYQLPAIPSHNLDEFVKQVLIHVARKLGRLGKGGIPNLHSAAEAVLNDWRDGKIVGWTLPKKTAVDDEHNAKIPSGLTGAIEPPKVEQNTTIVAEWSKEFDLGDLLNGGFTD